MCDDTARRRWESVGVAQWKGSLFAIEQCPDCFEHRGIELDPNTIEIAAPDPNPDTDNSPGADSADRSTPTDTPPDTVTGIDTDTDTGTETTTDSDSNSDTQSDSDTSDDSWLITE
jgi:hypothetical protein